MEFENAAGKIDPVWFQQNNHIFRENWENY